MAAQKGREFQVILTSVSPNAAIAGCRTKSLSWAGEAIDVTNDDSSGYRELLDGASIETLDISFEGVTTDNTMRTRGLNSGGTTQYTDFKLSFPNGDTLTGTFNLVSYEESGEYTDAVTFSAQIQSSGTWTYTPV